MRKYDITEDEEEVYNKVLRAKAGQEIDARIEALDIEVSETTFERIVSEYMQRVQDGGYDGMWTDMADEAITDCKFEKGIVYTEYEDDHCPFCGSNNIGFLSTLTESDIKNGLLKAGVECYSCLKTWNNVYSYGGFYIK